MLFTPFRVFVDRVPSNCHQYTSLSAPYQTERRVAATTSGIGNYAIVAFGNPSTLRPRLLPDSAPGSFAAASVGCVRKGAALFILVETNSNLWFHSHNPVALRVGRIKLQRTRHARDADGQCAVPEDPFVVPPSLFIAVEAQELRNRLLLQLARGAAGRQSFRNETGRLC
jgi:hypothetical protein